MWELFKDKNEYNEKNIIGFLSFALMCVFGIVDLAMGLPLINLPFAIAFNPSSKVKGTYLGFGVLFFFFC